MIDFSQFLSYFHAINRSNCPFFFKLLTSHQPPLINPRLESSFFRVQLLFQKVRNDTLIYIVQSTVKNSKMLDFEIHTIPVSFSLYLIHYIIYIWYWTLWLNNLQQACCLVTWYRWPEGFPRVPILKIQLMFHVKSQNFRPGTPGPTTTPAFV